MEIPLHFPWKNKQIWGVPRNFMIFVKNLENHWFSITFISNSGGGNSMKIPLYFPWKNKQIWGVPTFPLFEKKIIEIRFVFTAQSASGAAVGFWCKTIGFLKSKFARKSARIRPGPPKTINKPLARATFFGVEKRASILATGVERNRHSQKSKKNSKTKKNLEFESDYGEKVGRWIFVKTNQSTPGLRCRL